MPAREHRPRCWPTSSTSRTSPAETSCASGDLVPDEVVVEILRPALLLAGSRGGYVLDGFPRNVAQAETVDAVFGASGASVELVVHLDVPDPVLAERLLARGRDDDSASLIEHRLAVYRSQTLPMLHWYAQRQQLVVVDGHTFCRGREYTDRERRAGVASAAAAGGLMRAGRADLRSHSDGTVALVRTSSPLGRSAS